MDKKTLVLISFLSFLLLFSSSSHLAGAATETQQKYTVEGVMIVKYNHLCNGNDIWGGFAKLKAKGSYINLKDFSMSINKKKALLGGQGLKLYVTDNPWSLKRGNTLFKIYKKSTGLVRNKLNLPIITAAGMVPGPVKIVPKDGSTVRLERDDKYVRFKWTPTGDNVSFAISECPGGGCGFQPQFYQKHNVSRSAMSVPASEFKNNTYYKVIIFRKLKNLFNFTGLYGHGSFIEVQIEVSSKFKIIKKGGTTLRR